MFTGISAAVLAVILGSFAIGWLTSELWTGDRTATPPSGSVRWWRSTRAIRCRCGPSSPPSSGAVSVRGEFDEHFPTEAELVAGSGVSRATVREAIRRLRAEGLLDARRGSGTFVVRRQLDAPILGTSGLAQTITAAGLAPSSKLLRIEEGPAGERAARALELRARRPCNGSSGCASRTASRWRSTAPRWLGRPNGAHFWEATSRRARSTACWRRPAVCASPAAANGSAP